MPYSALIPNRPRVCSAPVVNAATLRATVVLHGSCEFVHEVSALHGLFGLMLHESSVRTSAILVA